MRLINANFVLSQVKSYFPDDENWTVTGEMAIELIHNIVTLRDTISVHEERRKEGADDVGKTS